MNPCSSALCRTSPTTPRDAPPLASLHDDLVDGRPVRPQGVRERLVHDDDVLAAGHVRRREVSAGANRNAHRREIPVAHDANERLGIVALLVHLTLTRHSPTPVAVEWKDVRERRAADTRDWANSRECVIVVGVRARLIGKP